MFSQMFSSNKPSNGPKSVQELLDAKDSNAIIDAVTKLAQSGELQELTQFRDTQGNTFLHLLVKNYPAATIDKIFKLITPMLSELINVTNNVGETPFIMTNNHHDQEKDILIKLIIPLAIEYSLKNVNTSPGKLNADELLKAYPETKTNKHLEDNIRLGCEIVNYCNDLHLSSNTHPSMQPYPIDLNIMNKINNMEDIESRIEKLRLNPNFRALEFTPQIVTAGVANCGEHATLAVNKAFHSSYEKVTRINIVKGDHAFIIIGLDDQCDLNKPDTYNADAVIVDSWARKVLPLKHLQYSNFMAFSQHLSPASIDGKEVVFKFNILTPFNPKYQSLERGGSWQQQKPYTQSPHQFFKAAPGLQLDTNQCGNSQKIVKAAA